MITDGRENPMGRIYEKAEREKEIEDLQSLLKSLEALRQGDSRELDAYLIELKKQIAQNNAQKGVGKIWDFSKEKKRVVFSRDDRVILRPVVRGDRDFYLHIKTQYSMMYRSIVNTEPERVPKLLDRDLRQPESFFCIVETPEHTPIGYLGIKNTRKICWEIAIELDGAYTHQGYGSHSIRMFLNEISRITGKTELCATVEVDNIPSQRCFESLGAEFVGLCDGAILRTPEDKARFEEQNLNLIDDHIRAVAARLSVEPRKLLSHLLEYRLTCPL